MASATATRGESITGINVTPLVDVVLVLLIILMVTAGYITSRAIPVELPKAASGEASTQVLAITLDAKGQLFLNAERTNHDALRTLVRQSHDRDPDTRAVIAADGTVAHRQVVEIIDLLRLEGVSRFAINVAPEERLPKQP